jgi:C-terminal processing protease CtpA/Prc
MGLLPTVVSVGDTTGGGMGNPVYRELPNGWIYRLPVWIQTDHEDQRLEDVGVLPDHPVHISEIDSRFGRDTILEVARRLLDGS